MTHHVDPSCWAAWGKRIGNLPRDIGARYNISLLTPKDWASHFKNILHRALWTKGKEGGACRCCKHVLENIQHYATCQVVGEIFKQLAALAGVDMRHASLQEQERFALFALPPGGARLARGWINLHLILWKYAIYALVQVELDEQKFHAHEVWRATWVRFDRRILAKAEALRTVALRADSRGTEPRDLSAASIHTSPIAEFNSEGALIHNEAVVGKIKQLGEPPPPFPRPRRRAQ
jgi:hypothetical protein